MQRVRRILSIDGGGIRGIIPATILATIEERTGKSISQLFDLIAGTSTGGLLALGLTKPNRFGDPEFSAQDLCQLYEQEVPRVFRHPQTWWGNLLSPKYRSFALQQVLKDSLGGSRLKQALTDVVIPCYDIEHRLPYIFRSYSASLQNDCDFPMTDVALAACASPTLFHPVQIPRESAGTFICLVDGGVFANNPAITALSEIRSIYPDDNERCFLVSLGTGKSKRPLTDEFVSLWGYVQWSRPMLDVVMDSNSEAVHEQMKSLMSSTAEPLYYRLQVDLPKQIDPAIDNASRTNVQALVSAAKEYCSDIRSGEQLNKTCETLLSLSSQTAQAPSANQARPRGDF
jgi:patatin-like phospholipase/acyl hydrolase